MRRGWLVLTASVATACGLSVTGIAPIDSDAGTAQSPSSTTDGGGDAISPVDQLDGSADPRADASAEGGAPDGGPTGSKGWCATQPTHQLCFDFDDGTLGALRVDRTGTNASCAVTGKALVCTSTDKSSTGYTVLKKWNPKPKTVDLAFDLTVLTGSYSQVGGVITNNSYYELLISPSDSNINYIEYPTGGSFAKVLSPRGTGVHRIRMQINFTTNHVTISEGGAVKYDASMQTSLASTSSAQALVGIYDSDQARTVTIDNVTVDWTN